MKIATITIASALMLSGNIAFAQTGTIKPPSAQGAPTSAAVDSMGRSTTPGAVKHGTSAGGVYNGPGVTTGAAPVAPMARPGPMVPPGKTASEQGAPTSAAVHSQGDETQPGAVKQGTSTGR